MIQVLLEYLIVHIEDEINSQNSYHAVCLPWLMYFKLIMIVKAYVKQSTGVVKMLGEEESVL